MTKAQMLEYLEELEDDEEVDLNGMIREQEEARREWIEELEERQHASGLYEFQDRLEMFRRER